jgi:hypothetical protein
VRSEPSAHHCFTLRGSLGGAKCSKEARIIRSGLAAAIRSIALWRQAAQLLILNAPSFLRATSIEGQADLVKVINYFIFN